MAARGHRSDELAEIPALSGPRIGGVERRHERREVEVRRRADHVEHIERESRHGLALGLEVGLALPFGGGDRHLHHLRRRDACRSRTRARSTPPLPSVVEEDVGRRSAVDVAGVARQRAAARQRLQVDDDEQIARAVEEGAAIDPAQLGRQRGGVEPLPEGDQVLRLAGLAVAVEVPRRGQELQRRLQVGVVDVPQRRPDERQQGLIVGDPGVRLAARRPSSASEEGADPASAAERPSRSRGPNWSP